VHVREGGSQVPKNSQETLLEVRNLSISFHTYEGEVAAVRNVDFSLRRGEVLAIVGESGCGKSVSTQAILGLTPIPPGEIKSGQILFKGQDLLKLDDVGLSRICGSQISMIFQDPMTSLNPTMKIGNQIAEIIRQHQKGRSKRDCIREAVELLRLVGIAEPETRVKQYPHELSGGMRQRVMIAMAMANRPEILIADEPTTALDVTIQSQIIRLIKELKSRFGTAIILITHDLGVVAGIADRIVVMYAGKVMEEGLTDQIYYAPRHPYTAGLLRAVPAMTDDSEKELRTIKGVPPSLLNLTPGCPFAPRCDYAMKVCALQEPEYHYQAENRVFCWLYDQRAAEQLAKFEGMKDRWA